jgi:hypothetical protein
MRGVRSGLLDAGDHAATGADVMSATVIFGVAAVVALVAVVVVLWAFYDVYQWMWSGL